MEMLLRPICKYFFTKHLYSKPAVQSTIKLSGCSSQGAGVNATASIQGPALAVASMQGNKQIIEILLNEGADMDASPWPDRAPAFQKASQGVHVQIVRWLFNRSANVKAQKGWPEAGTALQALRGRLLSEIKGDDDAAFAKSSHFYSKMAQSSGRIWILEKNNWE